MKFYIPKLKNLVLFVTYLGMQGCSMVGVVLDTKLDNHANKHSPRANRNINNTKHDLAPLTSLGLKADAYVINQLVTKVKRAIHQPQTPEQLCRELKGRKRERCLNDALMHAESNKVIKRETIDSQ